MISYKEFSFQEFYDVVKSLNNMHEDIWWIIYNYTKPKFKRYNKCILHHEHINYKENVIIYDVYFSNVELQYCYSYHTKRAFCKYAIENLLEKDNSTIKN